MGMQKEANMIAAFAAALRRMTRRPLRSILTVLEVALGALAVTLALNLTQGRQLAALPPDVFRVISGDRSDSSSTTYSLFQVSDLDKLRKRIPDAEVVEMYGMIWGSILEYKSERFKLLGGAQVNPGYISITPLEMLQGTFFTSKDIKSGTSPMVISQSLARLIFKEENPLGKTMQVAVGFTPPGMSPSFEAHRVIGVFHDPTDARFGADYAYLPFKVGADSPISLNIKAKPGQSKLAQTQALEAVRAVYKDNSTFKGFKKATGAAVLGLRHHHADHLFNRDFLNSTCGHHGTHQGDRNASRPRCNPQCDCAREFGECIRPGWFRCCDWRVNCRTTLTDHQKCNRTVPVLERTRVLPYCRARGCRHRACGWRAAWFLPSIAGLEIETRRSPEGDVKCNSLT
jgi:MacB-like periplasmic core domain